MKESSRFRQSRFVRLLVVVGMFAAIVQQLTLSTVSAAALPARLQPLNVAALDSANQKPLTHKGNLVAPMDAGQWLNLTIALKERDSTAFTQFLTDLQNPASPNYHHFINADEYALRFAPDAQTRQQVTDFLVAQGFTITSNQAGSSSISFRGTVAQAQNTFQVQVGRYQRADGSTFFANDRTPALAAAIASNVLDVFGLSNEVQLHTNYQILKGSDGKIQPHRGPQGNGYTPSDLRKAYNIPDNYTGAGSTIALYELGGYTASDIDVYDQTFNLPVGNRVNVSVDGQSCSSNDANFNNIAVQGEVELDIEIANAIAPQAKVIVYCGQYANGGPADYLNVYQAIATDAANHPDVVSESYGQDEAIFTAQGLVSYLEAENNYLRQLAAQGVSFFASAGDSGSFSGDHVTPNQPQDPATQPYLTSVGGTRLAVNGNGNNVTYNTETIWNAGPTGGGGSGGISNYWNKSTVPWQQGPGVANVYAAANPGRQFPDISADADPSSGYAIYTGDTNGGTNWYTFGGTSCASPLWAAIAADAVTVKGGRLGLLSPALYALFQTNKYAADFHDIIKGNNDLACIPGRVCNDANVPNYPFYPTTVGYDIASGIGTPIVANMIPDLINIASGPYLASSSEVKIGADVNGPAVSQSLSLSSFGNPVSVSYSTSITYAAGATGWLSINAPTGSVSNSSPANLTLTANPTGLAFGNYVATITFSGSAGGLTLPSYTTTVYLTVGAIHASTHNLTFNSSDLNGSPNPPTQNVVLTSTSTTPTNYVVNVQDWVGFVLINGQLYDASNSFGVPGAFAPLTNPVIVTVSKSNPVTISVGVSLTSSTTVTPTGSGPNLALEPGKYQAQIYVLQLPSNNNPNAVSRGADEQQINVTFNVNGQVLNSNPQQVTFNSSVNGTNPASQNVNVTESGFGTANANMPITVTIVSPAGVSTDASWLTVTYSNNTVSAGGSLSLTFIANTTGLVPGVYQAQVFVSSTNSNSSIIIPATLRVNPQPRLNINVNDLVFNVPISSTVPVTQTFTITPQDAPQPNGTIGFNIVKSGVPWLAVTPTSGTVTNTLTTSYPATITVSIDATKFISSTTKVGDAYNANVLVYNLANPDGDPNSGSSIRVPLVVNVVANPPGNIYTLPFVSNGAVNTVTFVTAQNLSSSSTATATVQYYNPSGMPITNTTVTIPANGQAVLQTATAFTNGNYGSATVSSSQPLNLLVTEAATGGTRLTSSAYNVSPSTGSVLYNPIALNGNFNGFTTNTFVYNAGNVTSTGTITYYDQNGTQVSSSDTFTVTPHTGQLFNQAGRTGLANNLSYWSVISGTAGSQLVAQVTENGPNNFLAIFEATPNLSQKLYQPTAYSQAFGSFNTGTAFANPNSVPATVTVTYYDAASGSISATQNITIPANGVGNAYTPASGVPATFVGSAIISSSQRIVATVNEQGAAGSGTYVALPNANRRVGLPAVANGFANFTTGTTLLNVSSQVIQVTLQYYDASGNPVNPALQYTVQPGASVLAYQGGNGQAALPTGFFGTAVLTSNVDGSLVATTNAAAPGLFYTYTEPAQ